MKQLRYSFIALFGIIGISAFSQTNLSICGSVTGANGSVAVIITVDPTVDTQQTLTTMTDPSGGFCIDVTTLADSGTVTVQIPCSGMIADIETQDWMSGGSVSMIFDMTYCGVTPTDCDAFFWAWNDSIGLDSINLPTNTIYVINESTGDNLSYFWDFGDGSSSTEAYPSHYYASEGTYNLCLTISNPANCTDTQCLTFTVTSTGDVIYGGMMMQGVYLNIVSEITLATNDIAQIASTLSVYPNPMNDSSTLLVHSAGSYQGTVEIYNMQGMLIQSQRQQIRKGQNFVMLNNSELSSGNYLIRLIDEAGRSKSIQVSK